MESILFIIIWAVSYRLKEIPHIWSKSTTYELRVKLGKWWIDASPRDSYIRGLTGINTFDDVYHFFGNLPRILFSLWMWYSVHWILGVSCFFIWFVVNDITLRLIIKDKK